MKKIIAVILSIWFAAMCLVGVSFSFIFSETISNFLAKALNLKIAPSYVGGDVAQDFYDVTGDDNGSGDLVYPSSPMFVQGSLDLVHYAVHQPVYEARWQTFPEYWQLDFEYAKSIKEVGNIMVYIDVDGDGKGCCETLFEDAENVSFDSEHPWDYAVWINGENNQVYDSDRNHVADGQVFYMNGGRKIIARIPLSEKNLQRIYGAEKTYHYVLTGAHSKYDRGGFMAIEKKNSDSRGGSENYGGLMPKIYDVLGDNEQLGTFSEAENRKAVLSPVAADMAKAKDGKDAGTVDGDEAFISEIKEMASIPSGEQDQYFGFESLDEAVKHFQNEVQHNPDDALALAHLGSCIAMEGGRANMMEAVMLVNKAFEYLDLAVTKATPENEFEVLMNRGNVSVSVPDMVFQKTASGAENFVRCAVIARNAFPENPALAASLYIRAAEAYRSIDKKTEANLAVFEAKKVMGR